MEFSSAYAAAKFGLEGWTESLAPEVAPFGIRTMLVEPGFFRTELLTPESTSYAQPAIEDYIERTKQTVTAWSSMDGRQGGDPAKLAEAPGPARGPARTAACAGPRALTRIATSSNKAKALLAQAGVYRDRPATSPTTTLKLTRIPPGAGTPSGELAPASAPARARTERTLACAGSAGDDVIASMTAEQPARRFVETTEVAGLITFLAGAGGAAINGACIQVDTGTLAG